MKNTILIDRETWQCHLVRSLRDRGVYQLTPNCESALEALYLNGYSDTDAADALIIYKAK